MSKIKILSENLANQIAAGEVIERPASIVKEFVENAVDAGARNVAVHVEGNGSRLIRVIDDGEGMDEDDVLLCLERHATSKISSSEELAAIRTLGFRGEAIPSVASVARLTITSRPASAPLGTQAEVRYGRVMKVHEMGCGPGTSMEVRDLFGNVPARRKFLKSAKTELLHIEETIINYALACHRLGITYSVDGRVVIRLPAAADSLEGRVKQLLGKRVTGPLIPVSGESAGPDAEKYPFSVSGCLLPLEQTTGSAARLKLFVNGRSVRDRMIVHAVTEGLRGFLMKGQRPAGVLFLRVPPDAVDVNVHPTKQEVRFHRADRVHKAIVQAVSRSVGRHEEEIKKTVFNLPQTRGKEGGPPHDPAAGRNSLPRHPATGPAVEEPQTLWQYAGKEGSSAGSASRRQTSETGPAAAAFMRPADGFPAKDRTVREGDRRDLSTGEVPPVAGPPFEEADSPVATTSPLKLIGQLFNSYLLCEGEHGLVAIDQHAAHERLLFEALKRQYASRTVASQALLFPKVIECDLDQMQALQKHADDIARLGVDIQEFGGESYVIKAVPAIMAGTPPEEIVTGILSQFTDTGGGQGQDAAARMDSVLATIACKAAIKAGRYLLPAEMHKLLEQMQETDVFSHCPHGRPVVKCFSPDEIRKWFYRT